MKIHQIFAALSLLSMCLCASMGHAADITATGSGNWSSTNVDMPWPNGIVPSTNDSVEIEAPFNVTVDTNVTVAFIYSMFSDGQVTMGPGTTLTVVGDANGAYGTQTLGILDATATSNTVVYTGNTFWAKRANYYNLVFTNGLTGVTNDFFNGGIPGYETPTPMTIAGDMTVLGPIRLQQGADMRIKGNLIIGTNSSWDSSSFVLTVQGKTTLNGLLQDLDGALGTNYFGDGLTVNSSPSGGWSISDVTQWAIGGSLTNNGRIAGGKGYGRIDFDGTGIITGNAFKVPTIGINGTYTIDTTITLTTNTPNLNGTLVFDIAKTNKILLPTLGTNQETFYFSGLLNVINSGSAPVAGKTYKFFDALTYDGTFTAVSYPQLSAGLSWVDKFASSGSIVVAGAAGSPILTLSQNGQALLLLWDSTTYPGYSVLAQTNAGGLGTNWSPASGITVSPLFITVNPANPPVFYRLSKP